MRTVLQIAAVMFSLVAFAVSVRADIFQWEFINPADPSQGKQQSMTLAPDGCGVEAVPGANLANRDLTMSYLIGSDLWDASGHKTKFTNADLTQSNLADADLAYANFYAATLADADFTGADVRHANFGISVNCSIHWGCDIDGTGLTLKQAYSTASYQAHDLSGIDVSFNNLAGGKFVGQNLTNASFRGATLTDANLTGADVRGADLSRVITSTGPRGGIQLAQLYSTASYQVHDLTGINLSQTNLAGGNFAGQNLTNASFDEAWLVGADFTDAEVRGVNFRVRHFGLGGVWHGSGITLAQLYSTASYQAKDLSGVVLQNNVLNSGNFAGQNLTNADFTGTWLNDADFTGAEIRGVSFARGDSGTGISGSQLYSTASYQAKDLRGIRGLSGLKLPGALATNLILPSGHISGLHLKGDGLVVRDYDGDARYSSTPPIPITIDQHLAMGPGGTLRIVLESDAWNSTISFAPGIPVTLGGTLELTFADDVSLATQIGRTFDLFNWTGIKPTGAFAVSSPYTWNLSSLYTTGEVTLIAVPEPNALCLLGFAPNALVAMGRLRLRFV